MAQNSFYLSLANMMMKTALMSGWDRIIMKGSNHLRGTRRNGRMIFVCTATLSTAKKKKPALTFKQPHIENVERRNNTEVDGKIQQAAHISIKTR